MKKSSELVIVKILTFAFSACANMKMDTAKHKLQEDKLRDEKMETKIEKDKGEQLVSDV